MADKKYCYATSISADGTVVVGYSYGTDFCQAFRWTNRDGLVGLPFVAGKPSCNWARAISADGRVIVGQSGNEACIWTNSGAVVKGLGDLFVDSFYGSNACGVSPDGKVVVGESASHNFHWDEPFVWTAEKRMQGLGGSIRQKTIRIYRHGKAIGGASDGTILLNNTETKNDVFSMDDTEAFLLKNRHAAKIDDLPGGHHYCFANYVSPGADVVVGEAESYRGKEAFIWKKGEGTIGLGNLGDIGSSCATSASPDGSIVVGQATSSKYGNEAFLWSADEGMQSLTALLTKTQFNHEGWILRNASGISADATTIVGTADRGDGVTRAWILTIKLEPVDDATTSLSEGSEISHMHAQTNANDSRLPLIDGYDLSAHDDETLQIQESNTSDVGGRHLTIVFSSRKTSRERKYLVELFPDGTPFSVEYFENGTPRTSEAWWSSGQKSLSISFQSGVPNGEWTFWNRSGKVVGQISYERSPPKVFAWDMSEIAQIESVNPFYSDIIGLAKETIASPKH